MVVLLHQQRLEFGIGEEPSIGGRHNGLALMESYPHPFHDPFVWLNAAGEDD